MALYGAVTSASFPNWSTYTTRTLRLSHDDVAPTVASHDVDGASLTLVFSEALDEDSVSAASAFDVEVDGTDARLANSGPVAIDGDTVTLTLATAPAETDVVMLAYTPPPANPLRDLRSNQVLAFVIDEVGYLGPRLVSAKLDGTSLKLTFSEPLDETKVPASSAFTVQSGGADVDLANTGAVAVSGNTVTLTLGSMPAGTATVTVNYQKPASDGLADGDGNEVQSFSGARSVINNVPVFQTAELGTDGTTLTLTYDEALDTASVPDKDAFAVTANAAAAALAATTPVSISGKTVVLNLATPARGGETVTVSYTIPTAHPVQDSAGNDAASLTDEPVTNSSAVNATGKPAISGGPRVGEELTAQMGTIADANGLTKAEAGDTGYAYEYQWIRVDGGAETDIPGADAKTYTPVADDEGKKLKVRVSFKDDADTAEALVSDAVPGLRRHNPAHGGVRTRPTYTGGAAETWSGWSGELTMGNDLQNPPAGSDSGTSVRRPALRNADAGRSSPWGRPTTRSSAATQQAVAQSGAELQRSLSTSRTPGRGLSEGWSCTTATRRWPCRTGPALGQRGQ